MSLVLCSLRCGLRCKEFRLALVKLFSLLPDIRNAFAAVAEHDADRISRTSDAPYFIPFILVPKPDAVRPVA
jgi:hypothetical protein